MAKTKHLGKNKRRYFLKDRDRNWSHYSIPEEQMESCKIETRSVRKVRIELSNGRKLQGTMTISSGSEFYLPTEFHKELRSVEWFDWEIVGYKTYPEPALDWV